MLGSLRLSNGICREQNTKYYSVRIAGLYLSCATCHQHFFNLLSARIPVSWLLTLGIGRPELLHQLHFVVDVYNHGIFVFASTARRCRGLSQEYFHRPPPVHLFTFSSANWSE